MTVADALLTMLALALLAGALAFAFTEPVADSRRAEELCEAKRRAEARDALARADRVKARAAADYGFDLAERQLAQHRAMPSREQVCADVSAVTGGHDRIEDIPALELLTFAAIVDGLRERPATAVDTEQAGGPFQW